MEKDLELALSKTIFKNKDDGVFVEPVCDFFGISFRNQQRKITKDPICQSDSTKKYDELFFNDKRLRLCIGKRGFIRWIQFINVQLVRKELQDLFLRYQIAVFDYLYYGDEYKTAQLEDIRTYVENINTALKVNRQVMDYIVEQKHHRDLCLVLTPNEWAKIKTTLVEEKELPESIDNMKAIKDNLPNDMKAIKDNLPNDIKELRRLNNVKRSYMVRDDNLLKYNNRSAQKEENPMPEGYRKEVIKLKIKENLLQIEKIDRKIEELTIQQLQQNIQ